MTPLDDEFKPVSRREPCAICGKPDWCRRSASGGHECHRTTDKVSGSFQRVAVTPNNFGVYRLSGGTGHAKPRLRNNAITPPPKAAKPPRVFDSPEAAAADFARWKCGEVEKIYEWMPNWYRARIKLPDGKTFCEITRQGEGWIQRGPKQPHPLYRQHELPLHGIVFVCEGEKACDAGRSIGLQCTTSGAADSAKRADWRSLAGREICILPDNDTPGARYAASVIQQLCALHPPAHVKVLALPGLANGDDLFEFVYMHCADQTADQVREEVLALATNAPLLTQPTVTRDAFQPFPLPDLPAPLAAFVHEHSKAMGCDPIFVAVPALASMAAAIGNSHIVEVKPGWLEPCVLWCVVVSRPSTYKTPGLEVALRPARRRQEVAIQAYRQAMRVYAEDRARWEGTAKSKRGPAPTPPTCERLIVEDITIEALAVRLQENPRGLCLVLDELAALFGSFNQYRPRGAGADEARYLSMFRASPLSVDRKSNNGPLIYVPRAALTITGGIQPATLARCLSPRFFENGFAGRFLWAMPPLTTRRWSDAVADPKVDADFEHVLNSLYDLPLRVDAQSAPEPLPVQLSREARERFKCFFDEHSTVSAELEEKEASAFGKLEAYCARFALLFHVVAAVSEGVRTDARPVTAATMEAAIRVTRWFAQEVRRIYAFLGGSDQERTRSELAEWIADRGGRVTARDLTHGLRRFRDRPDEACAALDELVEQGYGRWEAPPPAPAGGKPTKRFALLSTDTVTRTPAGDPVEGGSGDGDAGGAPQMGGAPPQGWALR